MVVVARLLTKLGLSVVTSAVILFGGAGRANWLWAWVYVGVSVAAVTATAAVLLQGDRELFGERTRAIAHARPWDKRLASAATALTSIVGLFVAGFDARVGWTPELPLSLHLSGLACFAAGSGLFTWAMASNRFFSTVVRIQTERGHIVVDAGPYRAVRHPGYVGWIVSALAAPLLLGSQWALVPATLGCCLMIARTAMEDRTLRRELPGYADYAGRVKWRLVPGVW